MQYSQSHKKSGTITVRVMCAVCFLAFSFVWVYWFQADMLAVAQHVLSQGVTQSEWSSAKLTWRTDERGQEMHEVEASCRGKDER
jgi:hypothetical protein